MKIIRKNEEEWKLVPVMIKDERIVLKVLDSGISHGDKLRFIKKEDKRTIAFSFKVWEMEFCISDDRHDQLGIIKQIGGYKDPYDFIFVGQEMTGDVASMVITGGICSCCYKSLSGYTSLLHGICRHCASNCEHIFVPNKSDGGQSCELCGTPR
jgi:hypothetical protein